jgi:hypothetical protein
MSEFCGREVSFPSFGFIRAKCLEIDFEFLINSFCFAICLRVIRGTHREFDA